MIQMSLNILRKFGKKIVDIDDYKDEEVEIDNEYCKSSLKIKEEKEKGSKFYWSEKMYFGYTKYFEIDGNTRRFFKQGKSYLWIKKP